MHIVICAKHVPNPDMPPVVYGIDEQRNEVRLPPGSPHVTSPFDEQAMEAALRLREQLGGARITVVTLGPESARAVVKHGLSLGADDGVLLSHPAFLGGDSVSTARTLAAAIRKLGGPDVVLCGRQASDTDAGTTAAAIAAVLDFPLVTFAKDVEVRGRCVRVERVVEDGFETVEADLPAVVTVSNELGAVRAANLRETMRAARKPVAVWSPADLALAAAEVGAAGARLVVRKKLLPVTDSQCEFIAGNSPAEQAAMLLRRLAEDWLLPL